MNISFKYTTYSQMKRHYKEKQIRREYTTARDIIRKRIKQMEKTAKTGMYSKGLRIKGQFYAGKIDPTKYGFYQKYKKGVPRLRDLSIDEATKELSEMKKWLQDPTSTIEGLYQDIKQRVHGLRQYGYKGINAENFKTFTDYMEQYRAQKLDHVVGSPEAADLYYSTRRIGVSPEELLKNLKLYATHQQALQSASASMIAKVKDDPAELRKYLEGLK